VSDNRNEEEEIDCKTVINKKMVLLSKFIHEICEYKEIFEETILINQNYDLIDKVIMTKFCLKFWKMLKIRGINSLSFLKRANIITKLELKSEIQTFVRCYGFHKSGVTEIEWIETPGMTLDIKVEDYWLKSLIHIQERFKINVLLLLMDCNSFDSRIIEVLNSVEKFMNYIIIENIFLDLISQFEYGDKDNYNNPLGDHLLSHTRINLLVFNIKYLYFPSDLRGTYDEEISYGTSEWIEFISKYKISKMFCYSGIFHLKEKPY
jgi:hypothetical protein